MLSAAAQARQPSLCRLPSFLRADLIGLGGGAEVTGSEVVRLSERDVGGAWTAGEGETLGGEDRGSDAMAAMVVMCQSMCCNGASCNWWCAGCR